MIRPCADDVPILGMESGVPEVLQPLRIERELIESGQSGENGPRKLGQGMVWRETVGTYRPQQSQPVVYQRGQDGQTEEREEGWREEDRGKNVGECARFMPVVDDMGYLCSRV
jgi:hypothetical protein